MTFLTWFPERRQGYEALWALELAGQVSLALAVANTRPDLGKSPSRASDESSLPDVFPGGERVGPAIPMPDVGDTVGGADGDRFKIKATIGAGSTGVVYRAKDLLLGRTVAIKVMRLHPSRSPQRTLGFFLVEARAIARLDHENIIRLFDAGTWRDLPYLVIEHLEGQPLYQFLSRELFSPRGAVGIMIQVLDGLEHAHGNGIVHRDLKPSNVFLLSGRTIKILDFGLAQMAAAAMGNALSPAAGTPGYMAPEQWRGEQQDQRADLWAAGVMLFEMLAGDRPFQAESSAGLRDLVTDDAQPPSLQRLAPGLPGEAERILNKALQKRPERRFQTAAELRAALRELEPLLQA
jgi:serine/threonine protein kinase